MDMRQMSAMVEACNTMMQGVDKPVAKAQPERRK